MNRGLLFNQISNSKLIPLISAIEVNEDGVFTRSSGADSGVSVSGGNGTPATSQFLDKRLVRRDLEKRERVAPLGMHSRF